MREVVIRPRAFNDLEGIWLYTYKKWGEEQAGRFVGRLNERILELAETAELGRARDEIRSGIFSIHVGRHLVFYTLTEEIVGVERVLHDQMDFERHWYGATGRSASDQLRPTVTPSGRPSCGARR